MKLAACSPYSPSKSFAVCLSAKLAQLGDDAASNRNCHAVVYRIFRKIVLLPPEEARQVTVLGIDVDLMEHALNVACHSNGFLSESQQDTSKVVRQQRTLQ